MMWSTNGNIVVPLLYLLTSHISPCRTSELRTRAKTVPAPLIVPPAQNWEGVDGPWNTFALQIGNPPQTVRVLVSTAIQQTWVVDPIGCTLMNGTICDDKRGNDFNSKTSSTWKDQGTYNLWAQQNLGFNSPVEDIGNFGYDSLSLGYSGQGMPTLKNQIIATFSTYDFFYGYFGINPKSTNWTDFNDPIPSYMTTLKNQSLIPSLSWGYTAGAQYRFNSVLSSLTIGGYDASRFIRNDVEFQFHSDNERDIVVMIQGINAIGSNIPSTNMIPQTFTSPIYAYIDSTASHIWLPKEVCDVFEQTFNLTYNTTTGLYHVSDAVHQQLIASNPNVTFTLGAAPGANGTVKISLPYSAFDKIALPPYQKLQTQQRYFPLRRAANDTQYTLGRTFLQEAYLIVDWERESFSVHQCDWVAGAAQHIVAIQAKDHTAGSSKSLAAGAIAGIVVGVAIAVTTMIALAVILLRRKKRSQRAARKAQEIAAVSTIKSISSHDSAEQGDNVIPKAELDAGQTPIDGTGMFYNPDKLKDMGSPIDSDASYTWINPVEADSKQMEIFEMPGDEPKMPEADGRQFSEKEAMRAREERYNGVDTYDPQTPVSIDSRMRRSPVSPNEVVEVIDRVGPRGNPVSPIDGSDGSRTMVFSPLSPLEGTVMNISPHSTNLPHSTTTTAPERKRFSYED